MAVYKDAKTNTWRVISATLTGRVSGNRRKSVVSDQAGSAGMGKGAAEQIDSRFGYDF